MKDKNGKIILPGYWVKESWNFHGFGSGESTFDIVEIVGKDKSFRFVRYNGLTKLNINRVSRMGWPVSGYEVEVVSKKEVEDIKNNKDYVLASPNASENKCYRKRMPWDK